MRRVCIFFALLVGAAMAEVMKVNLELGKEITIASDNYPEDANANSDLKWELTTEPDLKIQLKCDDIRLFEEKPCGPWVLFITDGEEKEELCTVKFDYEKQSKGNKLEINFKTGGEDRGFLHCTATAVKN